MLSLKVYRITKIIIRFSDTKFFFMYKKLVFQVEDGSMIIMFKSLWKNVWVPYKGTNFRVNSFLQDLFLRSEGIELEYFV